MRWLRRFVVTAAVLALMAPVAAWSVDHFFGRTVQPVAASDPEAVKLNRALYEKGDPVAEIYGVPSDRKMRVLFVSADKLVRPAEDRSLTLLLIDKQHGDNPLQVKTVWFVAWRVAAGFGVAAIVGLIPWLLIALRRRRRRGSSEPLGEAAG